MNVGSIILLQLVVIGGGVFLMDLTGMDTGSVHTNLFAQYEPPAICGEYSYVCCPTAIVGVAEPLSRVDISVVNFGVGSTTADERGVFYWQVPDWMIDGKEQIELSYMGVGRQ